MRLASPGGLNVFTVKRLKLVSHVQFAAGAQAFVGAVAPAWPCRSVVLADGKDRAGWAWPRPRAWAP